MAYVSNERGRLDVYVVPSPNPGSAKWLVSTNGGITPRWSRRGRELFYLDPASQLIAVQVATSLGFSVLGSKVLFNANDFAVTAVSRRN